MILTRLTGISLCMILLTATTLAAQQLPPLFQERNNDIVEMISDRVEAFQAVRLERLNEVCVLTDDQILQIKNLDRELLDQVQQSLRTEAASDRNTYFQFFHNIAPGVFVNTPYVSAYIQSDKYNASLHEILFDTQLTGLNRDADVRRKCCHEGFVSCLVDMIDDELYLTPEQRSAFTSHISATPRTHAFYSLREGYVRSPYMRPDSTFDAILECFTPLQKKHWDNLTSSQMNTSYLEPDIQTLESSLALAERSTDSQMSLFENRLHLKLDYYIQFLNLSATDSRHLLIAANGISQRDQLRHRNQLFYLQVQYAGILNASDTIRWAPNGGYESEPIWQDISSQYNFPAAIEARSKDRKTATVEHALAVFDTELWLSQPQRDSFRKTLEATVNQIEIPDRYFYNFRDEILFARLLSKLPAEDVDAVLSESQKRVLSLMSKQFLVLDKDVYWNSKHLGNGMLW